MATNNKVTVKFLADVDQMKRSLDSIDGKLSSFGKKMVGIGTAIAGAFVVKEIVDFGVAAVKSAGDLEQLVGASEQLFGPAAAADIQAWSQTTAGALGISQTGALDAANSLAVYGKQIGLTGGELVSWTQNQTTAAADMAAMFGGTATDAVGALTAAYKGNFEQMDKYGIPINATMLEQFGQQQLAIDGVWSSWDAGTRSGVIDAYVAQMNEANGVTGQAAREAETFAGVLQRLQATTEDISVAFGNALLPVVTEFSNTLLPIVQDLIPVFSELGQIIAEGLGPILKELASIMPALGTAFGEVAKVMSGVLSTAIGALAPVVISIATKFGELAQRVGPSLQRIIEALALVVDKLWDALDPVVDILVEVAITIIDMLTPFIEILAQVLADLFEAIAPVLKSFSLIVKALAPLYTAFAQLIAEVLTPLIPLITLTARILGQLLVKAFAWLSRSLGSNLKAFGEWAKNAAGVVGPVVETLLDWVASLAEGFAWLPVFGDQFQGIADNIRSSSDDITAAVLNIGNKALTAGDNLIAASAQMEALDFNVTDDIDWTTIYDLTPAEKKDIVNNAEANGEDVSGAIAKGAKSKKTEVKNALKDTVQNALNEAEKIFQSWYGKVVGWMDLGKAFEDANDKSAAAKARLASLNEELGQLIKTPDYDKAEEARLLAEIAQAGSEAGKTWLDRFADQVASGAEFARQLGDLRNSGLNETLVSQVAAMGPESGSQLATEILGSQDSGLIGKLNSQAGIINQAGVDLGNVMQKAAAPAGRDWGISFLLDEEKGLVKTIETNSKKVRKQIKKALDTEVEVKVVYKADFSQAGPAYNGGAAAGTAVVRSLQSYERLNGNKWRSRIR